VDPGDLRRRSDPPHKLAGRPDSKKAGDDPASMQFLLVKGVGLAALG
jgi:hypothetical protein